MVKTITFANFKGGTGKTSNSCLTAYSLSKLGKKVLLVDMDPQANATSLMLMTAQNIKDEIITFETTLMSAIAAGDLTPIVTEIKDNLYLLPSFADFTSYGLYLEKKFPDSQINRIMYFKSLLDKITADFDYVIIDTPPTLSIYTDSAVACSDEVVIVMQTQRRSMTGAESFLIYLQEMIDTYGMEFGLLGVLPVLLKKNSKIEFSILERATIFFGEGNMFHTLIPNLERIKRYDDMGITDNDYKRGPGINDPHDSNVHELFTNLAKEFMERLEDNNE